MLYKKGAVYFLLIERDIKRMKVSKGLLKLIWFLICVIIFYIFMFKDIFIFGSIILVIGLIGYSVIEFYFKKRKRNG